MKYLNHDVVFREFPDEVTLAVNLSGCPNRCPGCHSPQLQTDIGEPLTDAAVETLLERYGSTITCFCLMGGDGDPHEVGRIARFLHRQQTTPVKVGWYSGRQQLPQDFSLDGFNYIKLGPYIEKLGGLKAPTTNQRLYRIDPDGTLSDLTYRFQRP